MPEGVGPAGTPTPGVYRFEGPPPAALAEKFLSEQLASSDPVVAEPGAKLYRNAVVRKPLGGAAAGPLAFRVQERPGGTAIDVWLERPIQPAPDAAAAAAGAASGAPVFGGTAGEKPQPRYGTPAERRRATFEMLQKIERGEPLTKEDLDNPLLQ
jgi:hypothetical protein